mgnify:CR=1 FL=1
MGLFRHAASGLTLLMVTTLAVAQGPITSGGVADTLRRSTEVKPLPTLQSLVDQPPAATPAVPSATEKTITVDRFEFVGNRLYPAETLAALLTDYSKRPITLLQLYEAADKITAFYVGQGYTLASTTVPAQKVTEGSVRFEVLEGQIGKLRYENLNSYKPGTLDRYLGTLEGSIYRGAQFEQALRTVDVLPGLDVKARLQPGEAYGSSDLIVQATEHRLEGSVSIDNAGTDSIGVFRYAGQLSINNPLRYADQLSLFALRSRSHLGFKGKDGLLNYGSVSYSLPTGMGRSRLNASYGHAEFDVQGAFAGVGGKNQNAKLDLVSPMLQSTVDQLSLVAGISHTRANTDFSGTTFAESKVTVLEAGGRYAHTYPSRATSQLALLVGTNIGSTDAAGIDEQPVKIDLDVQHLMPLPYQFQILARTNLVYSTAVLADTQKFALGGPDSVRGYAPSEARGDWGGLAQLTLRRSVAFGALVLTPKAFFDAGVTRQHDLQRFPPGSQPQELTLTSAGAGFDVAFHKLSFKLDYAAPLSKAPVSDGKEDGRAYGMFSIAF